MTTIRKVGVVGAGVMGSQIAAHFINAGYDVLLLDVIPDWYFTREELEDIYSRNYFSRKGLEMAQSFKPNPFALDSFSDFIKIGSFIDDRDKLKDVSWTDDLEKLNDVDWVIEAVLEDVRVKGNVLRQIAKVVRPLTIISSNTSGIPLATLGEALSDDKRQNFLGTHFFNPPRYQEIVEIIPTNDTSSEVVARVSDFCDYNLGKTVVIAKDVPGFIANHIAVPGVMKNIHTMLKSGYTIEEVDMITGKVIGWDKSATFRTLDVVGLDVLEDVVGNLHGELLPRCYKETLVLPKFVSQLIENRWLGQKTGKGFYQKITYAGKKSEILVVNPETLEYEPRKVPKIVKIEKAKKITNTAKRLAFLCSGNDRVASYLQNTLFTTLVHAAQCVDEIAHDIVSVDTAMKKGFKWELGPFEIWDALGAENIVKQLDRQGEQIPPIVEDVLKSDSQSFYHRGSGKTFFFDVRTKTHKAQQVPDGIIILKDLKDREQVIEENQEASLIDLKDGVWCLEFHSKMNTIGLQTIEMMRIAVNEATANNTCKGLVIGNNGNHFSAGANLKLIVQTLIQGKKDKVDRFLKEFQDANMGLKYMSKPVVAAPFGYTFGGGCEVSLHAHRMYAHLETYMGLVETSVGLIPAGGGTKEMLLRTFENIPDDLLLTREFDPLPFMQRTLMTIGMAKVSGSAYEAKQLGYLRESDVIVMNKDRLLAQAKQGVLSLAQNYHKRRPQTTIFYGERVYSALKAGLYLMREAGVISTYDELIGTQIIKVLTGEDLSQPTRVSEQVVLDREREAMMALVGQEQTLERIAHRIGKSVRSLKMLGLGLKTKNAFSQLKGGKNE